MSDLPEVEMCANPECGGARACPDLHHEEWMLGCALWVPDGDTHFPSDDSVLRHLRRELVISSASDTAGVRHMVPPVAFTVHKGTRGLTVADRAAFTEAGHDTGKGEYYLAAYSGPGFRRDEVLAGQLAWSDDLVAERLSALGAAA